MPLSYLASTAPRDRGEIAVRQRALLQATKNVSHSDNQLLASNRTYTSLFILPRISLLLRRVLISNCAVEAMLSEWHSDPFLSVPVPTPIPAPRGFDANTIPNVPPRTAKPSPSPCRSPKFNRRKI